MRRTLGLLLALALLGGCSNIDSYFRVVAAEGLFLGLDVDELPDEIDFDLGSPAVAATFVARAQSLSDVSSNLVTDADSVTLRQGGSVFPLANMGDGLYEADATENAQLEYSENTAYTLTVVEDGVARTVVATAPPPPDLGERDETDLHPVGQGLSFDLGDQGYDNYVALVGTSDEEGNVQLSFDSRPVSAADYVDWIQARNTVDVVEIPGTAFAEAGTVYAVAIAGVERANNADFDGFNPLVSNFALGAMSVQAVITEP